MPRSIGTQLSRIPRQFRHRHAVISAKRDMNRWIYHCILEDFHWPWYKALTMGLARSTTSSQKSFRAGDRPCVEREWAISDVDTVWSCQGIASETASIRGLESRHSWACRSTICEDLCQQQRWAVTRTRTNILQLFSLGVGWLVLDHHKSTS